MLAHPFAPTSHPHLKQLGPTSMTLHDINILRPHVGPRISIVLAPSLSPSPLFSHPLPSSHFCSVPALTHILALSSPLPRPCHPHLIPASVAIASPWFCPVHAPTHILASTSTLHLQHHDVCTLALTARMRSHSTHGCICTHDRRYR